NGLPGRRKIRSPGPEGERETGQSEDDLACNLRHTIGTADVFRDLPEGTVVEVAIGVAVMFGVEGVERFQAHLKREALFEFDVFSKRGVEADESRARDQVAARSADRNGASWGLRHMTEGRGVEPLVDRPLVAGQNRIAHQVRPHTGETAGGVCSVDHVHWSSRTKIGDGTVAPSTQDGV